MVLVNGATGNVNNCFVDLQCLRPLPPQHGRFGNNSQIKTKNAYLKPLWQQLIRHKTMHIH